jgi:hypothetical protein
LTLQAEGRFHKEKNRGRGIFKKKTEMADPFFAFFQRKKNPPDNVPSRYVRNLMPCLFFFLIKKISIYYYKIILIHLPPPHLSLSPMRKKHAKQVPWMRQRGSPFLTFFSFFPFLFGLNFPSPPPKPPLQPPLPAAKP